MLPLLKKDGQENIYINKLKNVVYLNLCVWFSFFRNRMSLNANQAFYLIINNKSISSMSMTLAEVYRDEKDEDGFMYMTYASQEMFGWCALW